MLETHGVLSHFVFGASLKINTATSRHGSLATFQSAFRFPFNKYIFLRLRQPNLFNQPPLRIAISHSRQPHMAGIIDIRGSGLARAQRALAGLEEHPERLDRERRRFSDSPPPYKSDVSGATTRSQSPNPPTEEQRLRQQRRMQLAGEREASEPREQFQSSGRGREEADLECRTTYGLDGDNLRFVYLPGRGS